ncbi:hypothetical protein K8R62_04450 [bacterium]|nr:hypothetical protein [bacterium]
MTINNVEKIDDLVKVQRVLISVSDKADLEYLVPELLKINPDMEILSTGGTYNKIKKILGKEVGKNLTLVSDYTNQPETKGGLVKTLDFKIYLGLLTETYNDSHQKDLERTGAKPIDLVICNLYPFEETTKKAGINSEEIRGNIDIGGPCMIRAAAKNYLRVISIVDPKDYEELLNILEDYKGHTPLDFRVGLVEKAFIHTGDYDKIIAEHMTKIPFTKIKDAYSEIK